MDKGEDGKVAATWEEIGEGVEEGSTSGVSTINSNKSKAQTVVERQNVFWSLCFII